MLSSMNGIRTWQNSSIVVESALAITNALAIIYPTLYGGCKSPEDYKAVTTDLKRIYKADTEDIALIDLDAFSEKWDDKYPQISKSWISNWENLNTFFRYPKDIRKTIYTTNAIESLNSVFRKAIKNRKVFPNDHSAKKVIYIAIRAASKKWSKPNHSWRAAMNRFIIEFEDRLKKHL